VLHGVESGVRHRSDLDVESRGGVFGKFPKMAVSD